MTITRNLALTLSGALLALLFVSGYGFWQLTQFQERFAYVEANTIPAIVDLAEATAQMSDLRASTTVDDGQRRDREQHIEEAHRRLDAILARYATDHADYNIKQAFALGAQGEAAARFVLWTLAVTTLVALVLTTVLWTVRRSSDSVGVAAQSLEDQGQQLDLAVPAFQIKQLSSQSIEPSTDVASRRELSDVGPRGTRSLQIAPAVLEDWLLKENAM